MLSRWLPDSRIEGVSSNSVFCLSISMEANLPASYCRSEIEFRCPVSGCVCFTPGRVSDVVYDVGRELSNP